ncbi:hypothetical protein [Mobilicoccus caccae]|uniref:Uncharacterized protein n=1 Tax=Mobilicoccus caccae TaxID=1859295 RepID=A0ABQ6IN47_9MICO|nr:hypothetical protein [Mobilicoccus caccae]GMA39340.1 hypothetical protein GCM10025883_13850 [Mobilicoccus caccae]
MDMGSGGVVGVGTVRVRVVGTWPGVRGGADCSAGLCGGGVEVAVGRDASGEAAELGGRRSGASEVGAAVTVAGPGAPVGASTRGPRGVPTARSVGPVVDVGVGEFGLEFGVEEFGVGAAEVVVAGVGTSAGVDRAGISGVVGVGGPAGVGAAVGGWVTAGGVHGDPAGEEAGGCAWMRGSAGAPTAMVTARSRRTGTRTCTVVGVRPAELASSGRSS